MMESETSRQDIRLVTDAPGYLLLLHVAGGRARVMYPGKTTRPSSLPAGEYDLKALDADLPWHYERGGIIVATWSKTPIRTGEFVHHGHWAVGELNKTAFLSDAMQASINLATRLGASEDLQAASVEYNGGGTVTGAETLAHGRRSGMERAESIESLVYRNLVRIQGKCPAGSRDVDGAGETCRRPEDLRNRPSVVRKPLPDPAPPSNRPIYTPPAGRVQPAAPAPQRTSPPPASAPDKPRKPL